MIPDAGRWGKRGPRHLQRRSGSASSRRAGARAHEGDRQGLGGSGGSPQCGSVFGLSKSVSPSVNGDKCPPPLLGALQEISRWGWPRAWHLVCPPVLLSPGPGGPEKFGDKKNLRLMGRDKQAGLQQEGAGLRGAQERRAHRAGTMASAASLCAGWGPSTLCRCRREGSETRGWPAREGQTRLEPHPQPGAARRGIGSFSSVPREIAAARARGAGRSGSVSCVSTWASLASKGWEACFRGGYRSWQESKGAKIEDTGASVGDTARTVRVGK